MTANPKHGQRRRLGACWGSPPVLLATLGSAEAAERRENKDRHGVPDAQHSVVHDFCPRPGGQYPVECLKASHVQLLATQRCMEKLLLQ